MSEQAWLALVGIVGGVLGVLALGALALLLGRPLRTQGRARFGEDRELTVAVEVPEAAHARSVSPTRMFPPRITPEG